MAQLSRKQIAEAIADELISKGVNRNKLIEQTAALLLSEGRKNEVELVVNDVKNILFDKYGIAVTDVYSKNKLTDSNKKNVTKLVTTKLEAKKVVINEFIDESIIGGAMIFAAGVSFDLTVNTKLNKLRSMGA